MPNDLQDLEIHKFTELGAVKISPVSPSGVEQDKIDSADSCLSITDNSTNHDKCRAVYVGTSQNIDLYVGGAWVLFQGATAGSELDIKATGARKTSGSAAPSAGDIVFLY
jgi:hypothetical protein